MTRKNSSRLNIDLDPEKHRAFRTITEVQRPRTTMNQVIRDYVDSYIEDNKKLVEIINMQL